MEDCSDKSKRVRDDSLDSEVNSHESKIARVDSGPKMDSSESQLTRVNSVQSFANSEVREIVRVDSENKAFDSLGATEIQDDLLNILDDTENVAEHDLDFVIKSFEQEILAPAPNANPAPESGELPLNLGYLLEASDDELGLPPTPASGEEREAQISESGRVGQKEVDLSGFMGFEDDNHISEFGSIGFRSECSTEEDNGGGDFVMLDGLFDHSEPTDILWRSESLQAM